MVDEKEEHYEEEGEYHFSDDQVNYDIEPEASKAKPATGFNKEALLSKLTSQNRRRVLGVVFLIVLIGVVYKILVPSTPAPATDFNQATAAKTPKPPVTANNKATAPAKLTNGSAATQTSVAESKPVSPAFAQQNQQPAALIAVTPSPASAQAAAAAAEPVPSMPAYGVPTSAQTSQATQPAMSSSGQFAQAQPQQPTQPQPVMQQSMPSIDVQTKERVAALEQQNTAMMNLLQTEYAQKIADAETQTNTIRGKMEELNKRVNRMEASLNQITQILQGMSKSQAPGMMGNASGSLYNAPSRAAEPRIAYSVQAIIPGRAWLKSDSGDTVTVAEGDYLKKYGRVTKIDPYDGVVAIDTGSKVITLSYGLDSE